MALNQINGDVVWRVVQGESKKGNKPATVKRHVATMRHQTTNGTARGAPLNLDAVQVLREQIGKHPRYCCTYDGQPMRVDVTNTAWHTALRRAGGVQRRAQGPGLLEVAADGRPPCQVCD